MEINLLLFSSAQQLAGNKDSVKLVIPESGSVTGFDLANLIYEQHPYLSPLKGKCMLAYNCEYVENYSIVLNITPDVELAFIPPVSGG